MSFPLNKVSNQCAAATRERLVVGVADFVVSADPNAEMVTYALGSCIAVTIYDPVARVGGMLHFMLPVAAAAGVARDPGARPGMYGDVGIPLLFRAAYAQGAVKERLIVCAAGGAEILGDDGHFRVGARNRTLLRGIFWQNNVLIAAESTGGHSSRTMSLRLSDGRVEIRSQGTRSDLWPR
jgi:chemotaxis protein CheD